MRSAVPKHLHPLLGRRLVDWVIVARSARRRRPRRRRHLAATRATRSPGSRSRCRSSRSAPATRCARRARARGLRRRRARPQRRRPRADAGAPARRSSRRTGARAPRRPCSRSSRPTSACLRPHRPRRRRPPRADRRGRRRVARTSSRSREVNSGIYVFRAEKLWPALERLEPHNAQGELYLTDTLGFLVGDGDPVAVHVAADPFEAEGINTRVEFAARPRRLRDRINERTCSRA